MFDELKKQYMTGDITTIYPPQASLVKQERFTLFLGNFGSGKTEVAVNFALYLAATQQRLPITLVDLDLVNPYFRSREPRKIMEEQGIRVVVPDNQYMNADLPILVPEVRALLEASTSYGILDVGGDDVGARVLGALSDSLPPGSYRALMVLNANRPFTRDLAGIQRIRREIEAAGCLSINGLVSNTHLMEYTDIETIVEGRRLANEVEQHTGLPLEFVCVPPLLMSAAADCIPEPLLPIVRYLAPPWIKPVSSRDNLGKALYNL